MYVGFHQGTDAICNAACESICIGLLMIPFEFSFSARAFL